MLPQIFTTRIEDRFSGSSGSDAGNTSTQQNALTYKTDIDRMYSLSRSGLWGLLIFLASSAVAYYFRSYSLGGILPGEIMELIGPAPAVMLVNIVFGASTASSLLIIAGRLYYKLRPSNTWTHLDFRVIFYLLYFISGALNDYFNVVFISGLIVLALQQCNVWNYYTRAIEIMENKLENSGRGFSGK